MTINGEGNPGEELMTDRRKSVGARGNALNNYYPSIEYGEVPRRKIRKRMRFSGGELGTPSQFQLQPEPAVKRQEVSLTDFPRGRRKEEVTLIRQQYFRDGRSPTHHSRNARYAKRWHRTIHAPVYYKNRRDWAGRSRYCGDQMDGSARQPCETRLKSCLVEDLAPGTYVVQVEPESDDDCDEGDGTCTVERQKPTPAKYYYVFERMPFKVKFLNYVPSPFEEYIPPRPVMTPSLSEVSEKLTMPPFQCIPPECREVLYCKYFQCTSLGFFPDSRNCRKYFFCDLNSSGFVLYHMLCPKGRIFDPVLRECRLKEIMDKRDVQRCRMEAAKSRRSEKMRIKKNDSEDLIKYKMQPDVQYGMRPPWKRKRLYRVPEDRFEGKRNGTNRVRGRNMPNPPDMYDTWYHPKFRWKKMWTADPTPFPPANFTIPKYCEMFLTMMALTTTSIPETSRTTPTTTTALSTTETTSELPTTAATTSTTPKITACPPRRNKTCHSSKKQQYYLGDLDSDAYQDDMQDYSYDGYYDGDYGTEKSLESDYQWLRQGLTDYLDKLKKGSKVEKESNDSVTGIPTSAKSKDPNENENQQETELPTLKDQQTDTQPLNDSDRGKRSREKTSSTATIAEPTETSNDVQSLPDFEKCYKDAKSRNFDGYPCKEYGRYPDRYDNLCYYECGAQPDGNMRIEHKCCPKGEEFSPRYLECVASAYLKMTHRKRSASKQGKQNKKPPPEPEDNYEDDKEMPNEWLDASHTNKVPNEFKSKTKNTLRIFHLHCRRNSSDADDDVQDEDMPNDPSDDRKSNTRSFTVRANIKDEEEEDSEKIDDDEEDDYDDEEEYEDESEKSTVEIRSTTEKASQMETSSTARDVSTSTKVLLDADIHVGRDFENALRNILGKANDQEKDRKRDSKDSILIRLSGNKESERTKRNFLRGLFSKKPKGGGDYPDKEGVVSMMTLINGLPSEYERDALLQKLERRKLMNSHLFRARQGRRKRKKIEGNTYGNDILLSEVEQPN